MRGGGVCVVDCPFVNTSRHPDACFDHSFTDSLLAQFFFFSLLSVCVQGSETLGCSEPQGTHSIAQGKCAHSVGLGEQGGLKRKACGSHWAALAC